MDDQALAVFAFSHAGVNHQAFTVIVAPDEATARRVLEDILSRADVHTDHPIKLVGALETKQPGVIFVSEGE